MLKKEGHATFMRGSTVGFERRYAKEEKGLVRILAIVLGQRRKDGRPVARGLLFEGLLALQNYLHHLAEGGAVARGRCGTCVERREAFDLAGISDTTNYADADFWREAVKRRAV